MTTSTLIILLGDYVAIIKAMSKEDGRDGWGCWAASRGAASQRVNETLQKVFDLPARSPALRDKGRAETFIGEILAVHLLEMTFLSANIEEPFLKDRILRLCLPAPPSVY
jgi:hypothetical protein